MNRIKMEKLSRSSDRNIMLWEEFYCLRQPSTCRLSFLIYNLLRVDKADPVVSLSLRLKENKKNWSKKVIYT